jgi:hypothetical protein
VYYYFFHSLAMFSTQDSVDYAPTTHSVAYPQESSSPVRKKNRHRNYMDATNSREAEVANPFGISQDSYAPSQFSQFSQSFADRLGQMNMFCSQDNSNISGPETSLPSSFGASKTATTDNTLHNAKVSSLSAAVKAAAKSATAPAAAEIEPRVIDVAPPVQNTFLIGAPPHSEVYFDPSASLEHGPANKKPKRATKVWIGAFTERPRIITEFEELQVLGEGTFSTVMCMRHRLDGTLYAVKRVKEGIATQSFGQQLLREVNALAALQGCPQIVRYYNSWIESHHLFIQTELCHLGCLEDLISPRPSPSSVTHTAAVALTALLTGSHLSGTGHSSSAQDRNRSESFTSIDLDQADLLLEECLTAPGHCDSAQAGVGVAAAAAGGKAGQATVPKGNARGLLPPSMTYGTQRRLGGEDSNSGGMMFVTQQSQSQPNLHREGLAEGPRGIDEDLAWLVLYDVGRALKYMHERGSHCCYRYQ